MRGQLLACGAVSVVATGLLASLAALGLQDASPATRTLALFEVAAAAMFGHVGDGAGPRVHDASCSV